GRRDGAAPARRCAHRRGGRQPCGRGRGNGRGRPRQHGRAGPERSRAGDRPRRRRDTPRNGGGDRVRAGWRARVEGQNRADLALPRAPGHCGSGRRTHLERARTALRRPRPRAAPRQGALPRCRGGAQGAPRLAHLLGLAEHASGDRQDLFSAWRLFFERLAERSPVLLVFEDLQWADSALLDFVEHLLEWSHAHPLFVLALARPELAERRPGFGTASRNATTLSLEPLAPAAMEELLEGFVPGLPNDLRKRILDRAEGVPLYAVET